MFKLSALILTATLAFGCSADYPIWIPRSKSADPLYRFVKNGKAGYIDGIGRVVIRPKFEPYGNDGSEFHDGLLEIALSDGKYIDRTGKVVIDKDLYRGWDFSEGLAAAMTKSRELWGYINTSGEFAISPRFETSPNGYVSSFFDGLAMVEVKGKFGYIDHSGAFVIKPQFLDGLTFSDGMARVVAEGPCMYFPDGACGSANPRYVGAKPFADVPPCKFTFIDKTGRIITKERFDNARDFSEGLAPVRIGKLWGFIDKNASLVVAPQFNDARPFSSGLSLIRKNGRYGYADKTGSIKVAPQYQYLEDFSEGFAVAGDSAYQLWYIDTQGNRAIPGEFDLASPFFKGLAHVRLLSPDAAKMRATFAYINTKGSVVFKY